MSPTPAEITTKRSRQYYDGRFSSLPTGTLCDFPSLGESRNERPNPSTNIPVAINRGRSPVNLVRNAPRIIVGTPMATLQRTISQSRRCDFQYAAEAISVPGMTAGRGEATAIKPGTPIKLNNGVAIELPPFPNNPPRNPMRIPTANSPKWRKRPPCTDQVR